MQACKRLGLVAFCAVSLMSWGYDADTMAFYPFMDGAVGTVVGDAAGSVTNAVDETLYSGKSFSRSSYSWGGGSTSVVYPGNPQAVYSDDVPGTYIYDGFDSTEPFLRNDGEEKAYQSVHLPDALAGYTNSTDKSYVIYCPAITNDSARTVKASFKSDAVRPWGSSGIDFAGVDSALANEECWTLECFVKQGQVFTDGGQVIGFGNNNGVSFSKLKFYSAYGNWKRFACNGTSYEPDAIQNIHDMGWYHLAITYTNSTAKYYINHSLAVTTTAARDAVTNDTFVLRIGDYRNHYPGNPFYGKVAALRVTKRVLTPQEMLYASAMPRMGDLTITEDYEVPADGENYQNVKVNGAARITGGKLMVGGNLVVNENATFENSGVEFVNNGSAITVEAGKTLQMDAVVSGTANFSVTGTGRVNFNAANTFTGEMTITGGVIFHATHDGAFGSATGKTVFQSSSGYGNSQLWFDGVTVYEPFATYFDASQAKPRFFFAANTANVLYGKVTDSNGGRTNFRFEAGSLNVFSNEWTNMGAMDSGDNDKTAEIHIWGKMNVARTYFGGGRYYFHDRVSGLSENYGVRPTINDTFIMCRTNVFCTSDTATAALVGATLWFQNGILDLNGYDQRFSHVNDFNKTAMAGGVITSAVPAVLHLDNTKLPTDPTVADVFAASFTGKVGLSVEGPRLLTLDGRSTSEGTLSLRNGAQVTMGISGVWAGPVSVSGNGTKLTVGNANPFSENAELEVKDGATIDLNLNGASANIGTLKIGGVTYTEPGFYGAKGSGAAHEIEEITGNGFLNIPAALSSTFTWNAEGADDNLATSGNWEGGVVPDLVGGSDSAKFGIAGEQATVAADAKLAGMTFNRSFTLAAGGGTLSLGAEGVKVETEGNAERTLVEAAPLRLSGAQEWLLPGTNTTWRQTGAISGEAYAPVAFDGDGALYLDGDNSNYHGKMIFAGGYNGMRGLDVYPGGGTAFGTGKVEMNTHKEARTMFRFSAGKQVYPNEFEIVTTDRGSSGEMSFAADADVTFTNKVTIGTYNRSYYGQRARVVYAGGFDSIGTRSSLNDGTKIVITNVPSKITHIWSSGYNSTFEIWTSNNSWKDTGYGIGIESWFILDLHAPYAVCTNLVDTTVTPALRYWHGSSQILRPEIRLNGFNQSCAYLGLKKPDESSVESTEGTPCKITSDTPAQLEVTQDTSSELKMLCFEGGAGLTLSGTATLTLLHTANSTTGRLEVAGGSLVLGEGASWSNAAEVVVSSGSLALNAGNLFSKRVTDLKLETGATLNLAAGTVQQVRDLYVDGVKLAPRRTYTKDSPEVEGIIIGDGSVFVYGDGPGVKLYFR